MVEPREEPVKTIGLFKGKAPERGQPSQPALDKCVPTVCICALPQPRILLVPCWVSWRSKTFYERLSGARCWRAPDWPQSCSEKFSFYDPEGVGSYHGNNGISGSFPLLIPLSLSFLLHLVWKSQKAIKYQNPLPWSFTYCQSKGRGFPPDTWGHMRLSVYLIVYHYEISTFAGVILATFTLCGTE